MRLDYLKTIVEWGWAAGNEELGRIMATLVRECEDDDYEVEEIDESECHLIVIRDCPLGEIIWIIEIAGGPTIYDPGAWCEAMRDYAVEDETRCRLHREIVGS